MHRLIKAILLLMCISTALPAITADEILEGFSKLLAIPTISGSTKLQLIAQNGDVRVIEARIYQKNIGINQNNRLFVFDFPPAVRGTGLLLHSYFDGRNSNMWIYLPVVQRIKRVSLENAGGGYFMGSDFTYRDLISNDYNKMDYELAEEKTIDGINYYVMKAWGKSQEIRQDDGFAYILSYYRKDDLFMMRREYFDFNEDLLKVYQVEDILPLQTYLYPSKISMTNVQNGHKSVLAVTEVSTEEIPDQYFTTRFLKKTR